MPFGDGTGPSGHGPRTGRGAGFCSGGAVPGSMKRGGGFGPFGRGGGGRGRRNWFQAAGLTGWQRAAGASTAPASPAAAGLAGPGQEAGIRRDPPRGGPIPRETNPRGIHTP